MWYYSIDEKGKRVSVVLDIKTFEKLIEDFEDIYFGALAAKNLATESEIISHKEVKRTHGE